MTEEAIVDFDKTVQINPENAKCYYDRGQAKEALGPSRENNRLGTRPGRFGFAVYSPKCDLHS